MATRTKAAKQELKEALATIEQLQKRVTELQAYLRVDETLKRKTQPGDKKRDATAKDEVANAIAVLLSTNPHLKTKTIVEKLLLGNVRIPGQNNDAYVSQLLSRDSRFVASRKHGWSLTSSNVVRLVNGGST